MITTNNISEIENSYIKTEEISKWLELYDEDSIEFNVVDNDADITYNKNKDINYVEKLRAMIKKSNKL